MSFSNAAIELIEEVAETFLDLLLKRRMVERQFQSCLHSYPLLNHNCYGMCQMFDAGTHHLAASNDTVLAMSVKTDHSAWPVFDASPAPFEGAASDRRIFA